MKKNEAIIVRNRGGKLMEIKIICHGTSKNKRFSTDNVVDGAMETKTIPNKLDNFISWVDKNGRMEELEKLIHYVAR
ncbi:hypothetical protein [Candidatus Uabimicrobium amorphum]|uniref:Uncharacterized protein n=1 Tax=Uabimicrobium amorphum TaxID=2596890 RepID=A0A5S9F3U0_UABAM|nr:hypothetical protein [Candidatus Uabimicrobium amorphum]BBM84842.1 hypothetical protein UABAM_03203 [Candidatus Uabimicrobium amorphum]